jgi:hypothetical protein
MGTLYGAVIGATLMIVAENYLQAVMGRLGEAASGIPFVSSLLSADRWLLWLGILFVLSVYFFPTGVVGKLRAAAEARRQSKTERLLILDFVDINGQIAENQQVFTSGETQNFPPNLLVGQISSVRISPDELFRQANIRSLIDFDSLRLVLVITNFEAVDLEVFEETDEAAAP